MIDRRQLYLATDAPDGASTPTWWTACWLTVPDELRRSELQILVHGANSDHRYWDFPLEPERYSYVDWAAERGVATLALDRIGCGASCHPPGAEVTIDAHAATLSQLVAAARSGIPGAPRFERIVLIGASLGSVVAGMEAATFADVDAAVLTAYMPVDGDPDFGEELFDAAFQPAPLGMPRVRGLVDDDYLVPALPGGGGWLYRVDHADPAVIALEDEMAGTTTRAELTGAIHAGPAIRRSTVPTLVLVGQYDPLMYDGSTESDSHDASTRMAELSPSTFAYDVIADAGHALNLHKGAHAAFEKWASWLDGIGT